MSWQPATANQLAAIAIRLDELHVTHDDRPGFLRSIIDTDPQRLSREQASDMLSVLREEYDPDDEE